MNKYVSLFLFIFLVHSSYSLSAMDSVKEEDGYQSKGNTVKKSLFEIDFSECVTSLKDGTTIEKNGDKYVVLEKEPLLNEPFFCSGGANPCYTYGWGPSLLKRDDIENLPKDVPWILSAKDVGQYGNEAYITVRFTSNNNPHWGSLFSQYEELSSGLEPYWHEHADRHSTSQVRTVNFLLKKI